MDDELVDAVRTHNAVLFAGAGVSRPLGLPSFSQLMAELAVDLGYDPEVFHQLADPPTLAEYYDLEMGTLGPLRSRLDTTWHDPRIDISASELHQVITALEFPLIYTTNWDQWLERAHEAAGIKWQRVVGVGDLKDLDPEAVQIVKYHGDFSNDDSLVLTESSYMRRMDLSSPLDIKLRSDTLGKSILFIGYSLRDPNTRLLLFKLRELWRNTPHASAQPRSFMVTTRPNPVQDRVLSEWGVTSLLTELTDDPTDGLSELLANLAEMAHGKTGLVS